MKDHELILKMIEEVDPSDVDKLDEIDARVWCWLNEIVFKKPLTTKNLLDDGVRVRAYRTSIGDISTWLTPAHPKNEKWRYRFRGAYTRSRDALKAIRPQWKTWCFFGGYDEGNRFRAEIFAPDDNHPSNILQTQWLPTEELAELHAIIQAIAYERGL